MRRGFALGFVNYKKGALDSQPLVIKFTSCLPMVPGPASSTNKNGRHDIAEIVLKVTLKHQKSIKKKDQLTASDYPYCVFKLFFRHRGAVVVVFVW